MNERTLFDAALEIADPAKRRAFLENACADEPELLRTVLSLLEAHENAQSFLNQPALHFPPPVDHEHRPANDDDRTSDFSADQVQAALSSQQTRANQKASHNGVDNKDEEEEQLDFSFLKPPTKPNSIGTLGHYEILQLLGQGGFGIVFKAFDEKLHRLVAIKVMNPQMAATSPPRKRFLREARAVAAIKNENVVQVYSVEEQPLPYMVMEFIDGQTLQHKLDGNGPLEIDEVLYLGRQMASALTAAHALGIIHRDIKPGNILLEQGAEQKVKITDFGLARTVDDASMTHTGLISGTPMYMAPEQALGLTLDHRTDLFSLGSVLYQMTCGRPPFRAPNTVAVLRRVAEDTPRPLQEIVPELPNWLVAIINKLLAKQPDDRFQSAKELEELLARCRSELQVTGQVTSQLTRQLASPTAPQASSLVKPNPGRVQDEVANKKPVQLTLGWIFYLMMLGAFTMMPILFGKQLSTVMNAWIWPTIPVLPETAADSGLLFDGQDDFVSIDALDWSYPQFTVEAFVTSDADSDNGTIVQLASGGDKPEWMSLYDDHPADPGKRLSGAAIQGKTPFANTSAPLAPGVRQHRVLVFDGRYMHYYVNGIWQAKRFAEAREGMLWKMNKLRIACDGNQRRFFQGRIDQVRISRVARYDKNFAPITRLTSDEATLALYNFDEGQGDVLKDVTGHGHDGKINGARWAKMRQSKLTERTEGEVRPGLRFTTMDDQVTVDSLKFDPAQPQTIEAWVTVESITPSGYLSLVAALGPLDLKVTPSASSWEFVLWNKSIKKPFGEAPLMTKCQPGRLTHVCGVWDPKRGTSLFVDGQWIGTKTSLASSDLVHFAKDCLASAPSPSLLIGGSSQGTQLNGIIHEVRISRNVRYVDTFVPTHHWQNDPNTLALYDFAQGNGEVLKDVSGNGHDGTIVGATWILANPKSSTSSANSTPSQVAHSQSPISNSVKRIPLSTEWLKRVSGLSPEVQITEFTTEMKRRNPDWDGVVTPTIEDGKVVGLTFDAFHIQDLSPIVVLNSLRELIAISSQANQGLTDLTPLAQLKLLGDLRFRRCEKIVDLEPLRDLPIWRLYLIGSSVSDLSPLAGKAIEELQVDYCQNLKDISPLRGAPLQFHLGLNHTGVTDLAPLRDAKVSSLGYMVDRLDGNWEILSAWPLRTFNCFGPIPADTLRKLQELKTLEAIDNVPLADYLEGKR